jgi:hypothetical protein
MPSGHGQSGADCRVCERDCNGLGWKNQSGVSERTGKPEAPARGLANRSPKSRAGHRAIGASFSLCGPSLRQASLSLFLAWHGGWDSITNYPIKCCVVVFFNLLPLKILFNMCPSCCRFSDLPFLESSSLRPGSNHVGSFFACPSRQPTGLARSGLTVSRQRVRVRTCRFSPPQRRGQHS